MAFDCAPGGDPRGPSCPKCGRPVQSHEPSTIMHFDDNPGASGQVWHAECARPYWDRFSGVFDALNRGLGG